MQIHGHQPVGVFDMLKVGIGPSSSHTLGPWKAALNVARRQTGCTTIDIHLYGSLALTGKGHGTDIAVLLGLSGADPETFPVEKIIPVLETVTETRTLKFNGADSIPFDPDKNLHYHFDQSLPAHPNGIEFCAETPEGREVLRYYSIGGGFIEGPGAEEDEEKPEIPYPCKNIQDLKTHCRTNNLTLIQMVEANELAWRSGEQLNQGLDRIWQVMAESVTAGIHTHGILPGGLSVPRRASGMARQLWQIKSENQLPETWQTLVEGIRAFEWEFEQILSWLSCFALAVNEQNAGMGRIVTAPTNGSAGVIPAVILYYLCFRGRGAGIEEIRRMLMVAAEIGGFYKKGATISAAKGGCQAEIGVSSSMAAAALTDIQGGSLNHTLMASEIAMEHHLGLTCDPVGGLVQIPCIERNAMGAAKAVTAASLALAGEPEKAKVDLEQVIQTMKDTADDMSSKYKETSQGGLAVRIGVNVTEC